MNLKQFDKIVTDQLSRSELVLMGKGTEYAEEATDETEVDRLAHFKKAAALQDKQKMDAKVKVLQSTALYELLAEKDPELASMLTAYKELTKKEDMNHV